MGKYFSATARQAKTRVFLELKQGMMTMLEYVAKFTELAHVANDYVAIDMAKVRKFEDGLKLSIQGKIVGFILQDMDSMVRISMTIEIEIDDARSIRDAVLVRRRERINLLLAQGRSRGLMLHKDFRDRVEVIIT